MKSQREKRIWRALSAVFPFRRFAVVSFYLCWSYIRLQGSNVKGETFLQFSDTEKKTQKNSYFVHRAIEVSMIHIALNCIQQYHYFHFACNMR